MPTTTAKDLVPGKIVSARGVDCYGLDLTKFRTVADVQRAGFGDRLLTFTDGSSARVGGSREFTVSASRALPSLTDVYTCLLVAYATAATS
jgi:hypothetical protein